MIEEDTVTTEQNESSKVVKKWHEKLKAARKFDDAYYSKIPLWRRQVQGYKSEEGDDRFSANLFHAQFRSLMPHYFAKNPEIMVERALAIESEVYEAQEDFMRTLEIVVNKELDEAGLKRKAKKSVISTMTTALGWVKVSYQKTYGEDAYIIDRLQDSQDNIARLNTLANKLEGDDKAATEMEVAELERNMIGLQAQAEIVLNKGLVIDRVRTEDIGVDPDVCEIDEYIEAKWIDHRILMTADRAQDEYGLTDDDIKHCTKYSASGSKTVRDEDVKHVMAHEVWEKTSKTCFTLIEGLNDYAREPYAPPRQGERWYPFFGLIFNDDDGSRWPTPDTELAQPIIESYNETRDKFNLHRERAIPGLLGYKSALAPHDSKRLTVTEIGEFTLIDAPADDSVPISNLLMQKPYPSIDPALYDQSRDMHDLSLVLGNPDGNQGQLSNDKTLGEAEILREGLTTRTSDRRDTIEEWLTDIARFAAEVLLQELTLEDAISIAGPGAVWPEMDKDGIYKLVEVNIKAGSTGKPNQRKEQEQWIQFLPMLQETMQSVVMLRQQGLIPQAEGLIELMRETVKRFDERLDITKFFPPLEPMQPMGLEGVNQPTGFMGPQNEAII